jgi:rhamnosyltransferase subunit B
MRWLLTSWGSQGDLHPFLALGRGLVARGHAVTLISHPVWEPAVERAGLRFVSTGEPLLENFIRDHPQLLSTKWGGLVSLHTLLYQAIVPGFDPTLASLLAQAPTHDAIVAHHFSFCAPLVAELSGLPWATTTLAPGLVPSAYSLPGGNFGRTRHGFMGRCTNRLTWAVGKAITRAMFDPAVNRLRAKHGLCPIRDAIFEAHSPVLNLQLYSEHFAPRPPDWSPEKRFAGFCFYDPPPDVALDPVIEEFLNRGEPPVLFTLGSTAVKSAGTFYSLAVEALSALGLRGILLIGDEENRPANLPDSILAVPYAPYGLLMPRVRAVAHQCGIGTLSHALRAGIPSIAYPFAFDQPNNARRLEALGVAEVILPRERTVGHLTAALRKLLAGDAAVRAQRLGELIRAEDGVGRACEILEETLGRAGPR